MHFGLESLSRGASYCAFCDKSPRAVNIIKQNISLSIFVKALFVILAILGLITLMMSVGIGDLGLTLVVILNSFRIARVKDPLF